MKIIIAIADTNLKITHKDREFIFNIEDIVDLNEFIKYISESEGIIECEPESFATFSDSNPDITDEISKLIEYIFKIATAFNDSYTEIYRE